MDAPIPQIAVNPPGQRVIRVRTLTRLRWFAIVGQLVVSLGVRLGLGYELPIGWILLTVAAATWVNIYTTVTQPPARALKPNELTRFLVFDTAQIAVILYLTGGIQNPFAVWLMLPAMLAAAALDLRRTLIVGGAIGLALTVIAIFHQPLPWREDAQPDLPIIYELGLWVSLICGVGFITAYAHQVTMEQSKLVSALDATQKVLAREERLTALGGLAAVAAHELGTPLATIQVTAREMERDLPEGPLKEDAQLLISQTQRCQSILQRLSATGESGDARHSVLSIDDIMREAAKPFLQEERHTIEFAFDPLSQSAPPDRLRRQPEVIYGLRTLVENAVKYAETKTRLTARWDDRLVSVLIEDDGPGFTSDVLTRLGEPYPRADTPKRTGKQGLGLGFFIAKTLLERTGANIRFGNGADLSGAYVEVTWPLANLRAKTYIPTEQTI